MENLREDGEGKRKNEFWVTSLVCRSGFDPGMRSFFFLTETLCVSRNRKCLKNASHHLRKGNPDGKEMYLRAWLPWKVVDFDFKVILLFCRSRCRWCATSWGKEKRPGGEVGWGDSDYLIVHLSADFVKVFWSVLEGVDLRIVFFF